MSSTQGFENQARLDALSQQIAGVVNVLISPESKPLLLKALGVLALASTYEEHAAMSLALAEAEDREAEQ